MVQSLIYALLHNYIFQDTQITTDPLHLEKQFSLESEKKNSSPQIEGSKNSLYDDFFMFLNKDPDEKIALAHFGIHHCLNKEIRGLLTLILLFYFCGFHSFFFFIKQTVFSLKMALIYWLRRTICEDSSFEYTFDPNFDYSKLN